MYAYTEGLGIANNIQVVLAIIIIYFSYSKNNNFFKYNGYIFLGLKLLFTNIPILVRMIEYGQISIALITYYALLNLKKTKIEMKYLIYLGVIFYYILLTYRNAYVMISNVTNNF